MYSRGHQAPSSDVLCNCAEDCFFLNFLNVKQFLICYNLNCFSQPNQGHKVFSTSRTKKVFYLKSFCYIQQLSDQSLMRSCTSKTIQLF
uniref:Uncharacterized protein n=1 Tax=Anguilla anguilla TaxID=7936 RepID=A0A0E9WY71_ANGAN